MATRGLKAAGPTSFGQPNGNPNKGPGRVPGYSPEQWTRAMRHRAAKAATLKRIDTFLNDGSAPEDFKWAFREVADRGFPKPATSVDLTSKGQQLLPAEEREARLAAIVSAALQRAKQG